MDVELLSQLPPWDWPEDAGETILRTLRDRSAPASARTLAADLAGHLVVMSDELATTLLDLLEDPREDDELRGRTALAVGPVLEELDLELFDDPEEASVSPRMGETIRRTLRDVYLDGEASKFVRRRVLETSIRHPEPWHEGAVRSAYHSGDREWIVTAVFCMGRLPGFEDEILEAVRSDDRDVRYRGVVAAGRAEVRKAWPHIRPLLLGPTDDRALLLAAVEAVVGVRPEAAAAVLAHLVDSHDAGIVEAAEEAMEAAEAFLGGSDGSGFDGPGSRPPPSGPRGDGSGGRAS